MAAVPACSTAREVAAAHLYADSGQVQRLATEPAQAEAEDEVPHRQ